MKRHDEEITLIERALRYAHRNRRKFEARPEWERNVMSNIRSLRAIPLQSAKTAWEAPAVWRTAAAVSFCALVILVSSLISDAGAEYEAARFLIEDPVTFVFTQPLFP
ncbi:MAG: hypothetical protein HQL08_01295 [Nitrospirae bacterium]|nr:hypothetical protein [Nitrospirota bacterium]